MPRDRKRLSNPADAIDEVQLEFYAGNPANKINRDFGESFAAKDLDPPFTINAHFSASNLRNRLTSRKTILNPRLNFVGVDPESYQVFTGGKGRFDNQREELYDFGEGRANTKLRFTTYPEYKEMWAELYFNSPTVENPIRNPMPRLANVDPRRFIQNRADSAAENEYEGNKSVAQLMRPDDKDKNMKAKKKAEDKTA